MAELTGKTVLVAGAGRNNGRAIALAFAEEGANLALVSRKRRDELEDVATRCSELGASVVSILGDMTVGSDVERVVAEATSAVGPIDTLVTVMGLRPHKTVLELAPEEWEDVFAVNVRSTFLLARELLPGMVERGVGNIIALGGVSALRALPSRPAVNASKYALLGLIQSIANDHGPDGVRANMVVPGFIRNERLNPEWYPEAVAGTTHTQDQIDRTPLRREGTPGEVAQVAVFLASDRSSFVTGDYVACAGGRQL